MSMCVRNLSINLKWLMIFVLIFFFSYYWSFKVQSSEKDPLRHDLMSYSKNMTEPSETLVVKSSQIHTDSSLRKSAVNNLEGFIKESEGEHLEKNQNKSKLLTTQRPYECYGCFLQDFPILMGNRDVCQIQKNSQISLFIIVFSTLENIKNRMAIRRTWASVSKNNTSNIRYAFFLGRSMDRELQNEEKTYRDIIMTDFKDSYLNLTLKTMSGLRFAISYCHHTKYILKTDDDMWINLNALTSVLAQNGTADLMKNSIGGACYLKANPVRNKHSKWYASFNSYPNSTYPGYCHGTGYVLPMNVAEDILKISKNVPFFHLEDVYVSLCIKKLQYSLKKIKGFDAGESDPYSNLCTLKSKSVITWHKVKPETMDKIWTKNCNY